VSSEVATLNELTATGTSVLLAGELRKTPEGTKQKASRPPNPVSKHHVLSLVIHHAHS